MKINIPNFEFTWLLAVVLPLFAQGQVLPTPVLLSPANGATGQPTTVTIKWAAVVGADQYKVSVSTPNQSNNIFWDSTYIGTTLTLNNLVAGQSYLWRIKAKHAANPYQSSGWAATWTFTVGTVTPPPPPPSGLTAPGLLFPSNNSTLQVLGANLTWNAVSNATFYKVNIATDAGMTNLVFTDNNVAGTTRFAQNLNYNTTYFWTVQAANATSTGPVSGARQFTTMPDNPAAVTSHPRILFTQADIPRLQNWASTPGNVAFIALQNALNSAVNYYNANFFPGGQPNPNWPDNGGTTWTAAVTESYAEFFAFWSLIDPVAANRPLHAQRARNLLMYVIDRALLGPAAGVPFRDPGFMTYDRSRIYGEGCPLTVDMIYNAVDGNGNPILTAADKQKIRTVFMRWCSEQLPAYNHPTPIGLGNDKAIQITNRGILNNYFSGHARNLTFMSLAMDAADDAPVNANVHFSALGNSLRSYLFNATGAWLYQQYAQYELPAIVAADYGVPAAGLGMGSGGLSVESSLYGQSIGWVAQECLALKNAGWASEAVIGKQAKLVTSAYWTRMMDGLLNQITPQSKTFSGYSWMGPVFQQANYGDLLRTWITPEAIDVAGSMGLLDIALGGQQTHLDKCRWYSRNVLQGGSGLLAQRISNIWPNSYATQGILYFMLLDPAGSNPPDPRPNLPTSFFDNSFKKLHARSDWSANQSWFNWQCHWTSINHQSGDGNQFEFFRKGEWLIKERSGYTNDGVGTTGEFHNTLALQNDVPPNMQWYETPISARGAQWKEGLCAGDPSVVTSTGANFAYATGDATNLYNRYSGASDISFAVRSIVWLNPDHIVVYDRAKSKTANRYKRFFLQFASMPSISGKNATVTTAGGQKVFLSNLMPSASVLTAFPTENINSTAELETANSELKIEDPANPSDVRFLNVIQGADGNGVKDAATLVQSTAGTAFDGAVVKNMAVMFPSAWNGGFSTTTYSIPNTVTAQLVTGLTANAGYDVTVIPNGSNADVTIAPGSQLTADAGGVLKIGNINLKGGSVDDRSTSLKGKSPAAELFQNTPNPFCGETTIGYVLPETAPVSLKIVDIFGKTVATLADGVVEGGFHEVVFHASNLPSGLYFCEMKTGQARLTRRLIVQP